jgi:CheY-like chemotaxis protein
LNLPTFKVLVVDDDKDILFSLSKVLEMEGYIAKTAESGGEAIAKAGKEPFDIFLIDIKLPDMEGTDVLTRIKSINPDAIKIMITGNPSVDNAIKSLNIGASSFFTKPIGLDKLLTNMKDKLLERERQKSFDKRKIQEWVKLRISKIQTNEYSKFAEETADLFVFFGLSKSQAKIYIAVNTLGVATAAEIAALSKIRREEVYRIMPELENRGIIISKLDAPRKFASTEPQTALKILMDTKVESMEKEIRDLNQRKERLIEILQKTSFGIHEEKAVEALSRPENVKLRLKQMLKKASAKIFLVGSVEETQKIINLEDERKANVKTKIILDMSDSEDQEDEDVSGKSTIISYFGDKNFDLRQIKECMFNLVIVDGKEGIWGQAILDKTPRKVFWTNDPVQVKILERAFENLWQESSQIKAQ